MTVEQQHQTVREQQIQLTITQGALIKWFGDGMLTGAVRVANLEQTTVLDTLRVLDYPNDYAPVIQEKPPTEMAATPEMGEPPVTSSPIAPVPCPQQPPPPANPTLRVINKATLNAQLAKNHIDDVLTSLGLRFR